MKRFALPTALVFAIVLTRHSQARPPYPSIFMKEYELNGEVIKLAKEAKCNVCHDAERNSKKDRNEYGKSLAKNLTANDFNNLKGVKPALAAKVSAALKATEAEKNSEGKTYGEIIKSGKLPAK